MDACLDGWINGIYRDVMTWKCFLHYWPFVRGNHRSPMDFPHKGPGMRAAFLAFCEGKPSITDGFPSQRAWNAGFDVCLNNWLNKPSSWVTGDLRRCDVSVIFMSKDVTTLKMYRLIQTQYTKGEISDLWTTYIFNIASKQIQFHKVLKDDGNIPYVFPDSKVHGAHLGPTGPRWAPWWPHELCYLGLLNTQSESVWEYLLETWLYIIIK